MTAFTGMRCSEPMTLAYVVNVVLEVTRCHKGVLCWVMLSLSPNTLAQLKSTSHPLQTKLSVLRQLINNYSSHGDNPETIPSCLSLSLEWISNVRFEGNAAGREMDCTEGSNAEALEGLVLGSRVVTYVISLSGLLRESAHETSRVSQNEQQISTARDSLTAHTNRISRLIAHITSSLLPMYTFIRTIHHPTADTKNRTGEWTLLAREMRTAIAVMVQLTHCLLLHLSSSPSPLATNTLTTQPQHSQPQYSQPQQPQSQSYDMLLRGYCRAVQCRLFASSTQLSGAPSEVTAAVLSLWHAFPSCRPPNSPKPLVTWLALPRLTAVPESLPTAILGEIKAATATELGRGLAVSQLCRLLSARLPVPSPNLHTILHTLETGLFPGLSDMFIAQTSPSPAPPPSIQAIIWAVSHTLQTNAHKHTESVNTHSEYYNSCEYDSNVLLSRGSERERAVRRVFLWPPSERVSLFQCLLLDSLTHSEDGDLILQSLLESSPLLIYLTQSLAIQGDGVWAFAPLRKLLLTHQSSPEPFHTAIPAFIALLNPSTQPASNDSSTPRTHYHSTTSDRRSHANVAISPTLAQALCELSWTLMFMHTGHPLVYEPLQAAIEACAVKQPGEREMLRWISESRLPTLNTPTHTQTAHTATYNHVNTVTARTPGLLAGIANTGNTCFMNASIQALYALPTLRQMCIDKPTDSEQARSMLVEHFRACILQLTNTPHSHIRPAQLAVLQTGLGFSLGVQHDATEFVRALLNVLLESETYKEHVKREFEGVIASTTICHTCHSHSRTQTPFLDLPLALDEQALDRQQNVMNLLEGVVAEETLKGENAYRCDTCQTLVEATRTHSITHLPPALILSVSRFSYSVEKQQRHKQLTPLHVPLELRLNIPEQSAVAPADSDQANSLCHRPRAYELKGVVIHSGCSAQSGHYYAIVRDPNGDWSLCNDSTVTKTDSDALERIQSSFKNDSVYLLVYSQRPDTRPQ